MALKIDRSPFEKHAPVSETFFAHLYRAEVSRSTAWRTRLDTTTNWAITSAAAVASLSFSRQAHHVMLLAGIALVTVFLWVEARRYRYYDLWARRVRLIETGYVVPRLRREGVPVDFHSQYATELSKPRLRVSALDSLSFRLRRTYAPILVLLLGAWVVKLDMHPTQARTFAELVERAHIGPVPGAVVWASWVLVLIAGALLWWHGYQRPLPPTELRAASRRTEERLASALQRLSRAGPVVPRARPERPSARQAEK